MKIEKYNEFNMQVREGLIKTYPIKTAIKLISRELSILKIKHNIDMEESTNTIFVKMLSSNIDKNVLLNIMRGITLCGYFISNYDFYNSNDDNIDYLIHKNLIDSTFMDELFMKISNSYYTQITIESKYNSKVILPEYLYHVTSEKNKDKIEKVGLIPKSPNKRANHNDRIYLGYNSVVVKNLAYQFSPGKYILLKILTKDININIYDDPDFITNAVYTYDNISPKNIEIIENFIV